MLEDSQLANKNVKEHNNREASVQQIIKVYYKMIIKLIRCDYRNNQHNRMRLESTKTDPNVHINIVQVLLRISR